MKNIASLFLLCVVFASLIGCEDKAPPQNDPCDTIMERRTNPKCVDRKAPGTAQVPLPILPTDQIPQQPLPVPVPVPTITPTPAPIKTKPVKPTKPQEKQQIVPFNNPSDLA